MHYEGLNRCGWSESGGVGKLNDSYFSCERLLNDWFKIDNKTDHLLPLKNPF